MSREQLMLESIQCQAASSSAPQEEDQPSGVTFKPNPLGRYAALSPFFRLGTRNKVVDRGSSDFKLPVRDQFSQLQATPNGRIGVRKISSEFGLSNQFSRCSTCSAAIPLRGATYPVARHDIDSFSLSSSLRICARA